MSLPQTVPCEAQRLRGARENGPCFFIRASETRDGCRAAWRTGHPSASRVGPGATRNRVARRWVHGEPSADLDDQDVRQLALAVFDDLKRLNAQHNSTLVLVYLPQEGRGIGLSAKIEAYSLQDGGLDTVEANLALGYKADPRDFGIGIQLLKDLGLRKIRLLTNNPKKTDAFIYGGFDLEVVDQIPIVGPINEHNAEYLSAKRDKLGHQLPKS